MKILLLTADRETARIYSDAAERAGNLRICVRKNTAQVLERLFRDPFDALLSEDASVVRAGIRSCPVQWPPNIFLLVDRLSGPLRMPQTLTFCFMKDSDPLNVLNCIAGFPKTAQNHTDTETAISRFLQQMGVPVSLNGFDCLRIALRILLAQNNLLDCPINELYTVLSEIMGIGAYVAEHTVRHAIDAAWIRADTALQEQIFGYTVRSDRGAPSNAAFLLRAADHMKMTGEGTMGMTLEEMHEMEDDLRSRYSDGEALLDATINAVMRALCVPAKLLGYRYIFLAVRFIRTRPPLLRSTTKKELYPYLENCMNTTKPMIMRTMHYAIERAWKRADPEVLYSYLGLRGKNLKEVPGNIEYVYLIAERVRLIIGDPAFEEHYQRVIAEMRKIYPWLN